MYWLTAYNTPPGGRTFSLGTEDLEHALELSLDHVKKVSGRDAYLNALEGFINQLGWHIERKDNENIHIP